MIKKAPADSGDRELQRALKGDAGGGGLNSGHPPPKTSLILDHWPTNKRLSQIQFAPRPSALCVCVFTLEGNFTSISIGRGGFFKDPGTEVITLPLVGLFRKVPKQRRLLFSDGVSDGKSPFTGLKAEKLACSGSWSLQLKACFHVSEYWSKFVNCWQIGWMMDECTFTPAPFKFCSY